MDLVAFYGAWVKVIDIVFKRAKLISYIISPTQNEDGSVIDRATDMLDPFCRAGWRVERRIIVPYQTQQATGQQATGQQVTWARDKKRMLKLYRDLVVLAP